MQGSGMSEGGWVTLGANEVEDLTCLVQVLAQILLPPVDSLDMLQIVTL